MRFLDAEYAKTEPPDLYFAAITCPNCDVLAADDPTCQTCGYVLDPEEAEEPYSPSALLRPAEPDQGSRSQNRSDGLSALKTVLLGLVCRMRGRH